MSQYPENEYVANQLDLKRKNQETYDRTRQLAQAHKWDEHIEVAAPMIPVLHYLGYTDWVSRMLGRLAWSHIRLGEFDKADKLLQWSEDYDIWQAAANYYWAVEYSHRSRNDGYARKCLEKFKSQADTLGISGNTDLELAVNFYKQLQRVEETASFYHSNNKSDRGRYLELKARLEQDSVGFERAAKIYQDAKLEPYAACCRAFAHLMIAQRESDFRKMRKEFELASNEITATSVFEDDYIKALLIKFISVRITLCDLMIALASKNAKRILVVEENYKKIYEEFSRSTVESLSSLALNIVSFSSTAEWDQLERLVSSFKDSVCPDDIGYYQNLDSLFNSAQSKLPSYSFLTI